MPLTATIPCPYCKSRDVGVLDSRGNQKGTVRRRRICRSCHRKFSTVENVVWSAKDLAVLMSL